MAGTRKYIEVEGVAPSALEEKLDAEIKSFEVHHQEPQYEHFGEY